MIVRISVEIQAEPQDGMGGSYGSMRFSEEAGLNGSNFDLVSKVFTRIHDLLAALSAEHGRNQARR